MCLLWLVVGIVFASLIIFLFTSNVLAKRFTPQFLHKNSIPTSIDALIGKNGIVLEAIAASTHRVGQVKLDGEIWSAITLDNTPIEKGTTVIVQEIRGVRLVVTPNQEDTPPL